MGNNSEPDKLVIDRGLFREQLERRISIGSEILGREIISDLQLKQAGADYEDWDSYNSELLKCSFNNSNNEYRKDYDCVRRVILLGGHKYSFSDWMEESHKGRVQEKLDRLIRLEKKIDLLRSNLESSPMGKTQVACSKDKIFIVHGHDEAVREKVARFLERLELKPIILHEQANSGKTIIEKFESHANVEFAVILLTGDDVGKVKTAEKDSLRARQNVILEWGFFIGKLGRNKVCALYEKGVELPSDLHGLLYLSLEDRGWQMDLAKELKEAGYEINLNKLL